MDEAAMPQRDTIKKAFLEAPVPDKYNDHNISVRVFEPASMKLTKEDWDAYRAAAQVELKENGKPKKKGGFGKAMKAVAGAALATATGSESSTMVDDKDKEEYAVYSYKHLLEQQVAKELFDKWFVNEDGEFHMGLVQERGLYDASAMDVQTAKNSIRGMGMLADAGEELVNNTFVVVSRFRYMSKEELQKEIEATANAVGSAFGEYGKLGAQIVNTTTQFSLGDGYYVRATSFLFQLDWNEEIANTFYSELWGDPEKYHAADIFSLKYIGQESAFANVKAGIFSNKPQGELVRIATVNANDAVIAKLQKKYDVFKTKTPLLSTQPLSAAIGMKEGVEPGDRFEVLEQTMDPETGKTTYRRKGVITASKDQIWDNRYMADLEQSEESQELKMTVFEGNASGLYPGMLLRQIK